MKVSLLCALMGFCSVASATTEYYVSPTGNDLTGTGSLTAPWATVQKAMFTIPFDQDDVNVNLREGTYILSSAIFISGVRGGSASGTFTIKSHDGENAILDGSLIGVGGDMVTITNTSYVSLDGLEFTNLIGNKTGIRVTEASSNISIKNNEIHEMHWTTDATAALSPAASDNLSPIAVLGTNDTPITALTISGNTVYDLTTGFSEAVKIVGNVDGFLVEDNTVHDVANICIVAAGNYDYITLTDDTLNHARNGIIRGNEVFRCVSPIADSAGIYADGAQNILITKNSSHNNTVGFSVGGEELGNTTGGITLTDNNSADNTRAGIVIGSITTGSDVSGVIVTENKFSGNYTDPVFGGGPIIMNTVRNVTINDNDINSISQYMVTVTAAVTNLSLDNNRYTSDTVDAANAVFSWVGITGVDYFGFDSYRTATGQDSLSTFSKN